MACKRCDQAWERLWEKSDAWERAHSNEGELWSTESEQSRELINEALAIEDADPAAALSIYLEGAEAGSVWSMEKAAWHYHTGTGIAADHQKALEYYYRAICAGSWMATLHYARCLAKLGRHDDCRSVLEDGVASGFVPAYFWLAWFRYERSKTRAVCQEVRALMEYAAKKGHPEANVTLARWMLFGKFGPRKILGGLSLAIQSAIRWAGETPEDTAFQDTAYQEGGRE